MTRILTSLVVVLVAVTVAAGCGPRPSDRIDTSGGPEDVSLKVISHNFSNVVVYLYLGESRHRLGIAGGNSVTDFTIPWRQVSGNRAVRLFCEAIGAGPAFTSRITQEQHEDLRDHGQAEGQVTSDTLQLTPGARVVWTLEARLDQSMASVY